MRAVDIALKLWKRGHRPYIPHLTHYVDKRAQQTGVCMGWEDYLEWDEAWIDVCDALLYLGDSNGAKREREYAERKGKTIFEDLDEIPVISKKEGEVCEPKEDKTS
jgi:hypothetical protein